MGHHERQSDSYDHYARARGRVLANTNILHFIYTIFKQRYFAPGMRVRDAELHIDDRPSFGFAAASPAGGTPAPQNQRGTLVIGRRDARPTRPTRDLCDWQARRPPHKTSRSPCGAGVSPAVWRYHLMFAMKIVCFGPLAPRRAGTVSVETLNPALARRRSKALSGSADHTPSTPPGRRQRWMAARPAGP